MAVDEKNLEERKVRALEDIASSFRDLNDWMMLLITEFKIKRE